MELEYAPRTAHLYSPLLPTPAVAERAGVFICANITMRSRKGSFPHKTPKPTCSQVGFCVQNVILIYMKSRKVKKEFWHKRFFVLTADPFDTDVGIAINATEAEIKKWLKGVSKEKYGMFDEKELEDWDNSKTNLGRMIPMGGGFVLIIKADKKYFRKFVGTLTHEIIHAVHYMLRNRRVPLSEDTEEVYAYSIESLLRHALYEIY